MSFLIYLDYMFNYLFDFDGTLFDSEFAHKQAFQNTFNYFNLGVMPDYSQIMGVKTKDVFSKFTNDENFLQAGKRKLRHQYREQQCKKVRDRIEQTLQQ